MRCRWPVKNSGLMIYTVLLKKMLLQSVNKNNASNYTVAQFFVKYHYLKSWFSAKLAIQEPVEKSELIAGLHPILFCFIVLTSRLSGNASDTKDGACAMSVSRTRLAYRHHAENRGSERVAEPVLPHDVGAVAGAWCVMG